MLETPGDPVAPLDFAGELLAEIASELADRPEDAAALLARLEREAGLAPLALGRELLRSVYLPGLAPQAALSVQLRLLLVLTSAPGASIWELDSSGAPRMVAQAGEVETDARHARAALEHGTGIGPIIERAGGDRAVLMLAGEQGTAGRGALMRALAPILGATLDRAAVAPERPPPSALTAIGHRLDRVRYDLHDGPQQDLQLLGIDLKLFRQQLSQRIDDLPGGAQLLGRLDDFEAQLVALDGDLRQISHSLQSPFLPDGTLTDALDQITHAFAGRTGVKPEVKLSGDFAALSDSQQITLLALIREALSNVREHSDASAVVITVAAREDGLEASVIDDGRGFDPETRLVAAGRAGHLGLIGIYERVRMLGGTARIESRPGGPTAVSAWIPAWRPDDGD